MIKLRQLILRFVVNYIEKHMAHEYTAERNAILRAVNDGMVFTFYEDNAYTRLHNTVHWLVQNDYYYKHRDVENLATCAASGVREALTGKLP